MNILSKLDIFGEPVSLFYRKKTHFKTGLGGCFTIISFVVLLFYTWTISMTIYRKENQTLQAVKFKNPTEMDETYEISTVTHFNIFMDIYYFGDDYGFYDLDYTKYFRIEAISSRQSYINDFYAPRKIDLVPCEGEVL